MPANATVPMRRSTIAGSRRQVRFHPSAMPVATITTACAISTATTFTVFAASRPPRDSGVEPSRFSTP